MGPIETYAAKKNIDEITLTFAPGEEIYLIKGNFETCRTNSNVKSIKIVKMTIYTTFGQYIEFGSKNLNFNFTWEYFFNMRQFDGFYIGWDDSHINYMASLVVEKSQTEQVPQLKDSINQTRLNAIDPIFLTPVYGRNDPYANLDDDLHKNTIFQDAKDRLIYISEINIFYDKYIHAIEVEYTNKTTREKMKCHHVGSDTKKNKDRKGTLSIAENDCVNFIRFSYDTYIQTLTLKTLSGKFLNVAQGTEAENKVEIYDGSLDVTVNLLGLIVGYGDKVQSLQFYYDKKLI